MQDPTQKVGKKRRRILLAAILYERQHGHAATWSELQVITGYKTYDVANCIGRLKRQGLVDFEQKPRSLKITNAGREFVREWLAERAKRAA